MDNNFHEKKTVAPDGLPYDIDILGDLSEDEVEIIQYLRPYGKRRKMSTVLPKEIAKLSKEMIISAEVLTTGDIAIYGRMKDMPPESEYMLIAENYAGEKTPNKILEKVIIEVARKHQMDQK